ncbi:MAG: hypothetical protein U1F54_04660 [Burkholderiales bacterium]
MALPKLYEVLRPSECPDKPFADLLRLIAKSRDGQGLWLSPMSVKTRSGYARAPIYRTCAEVEGWIARGWASASPLVTPGHWLMTDVQIRGRELAPDEPETNPRLIKRNADWALIREFVDQHGTADILEERLLTPWIRVQAQRCRVSKRRLYCAIHRYWASGCNRNALLPEFAQCGAPNQPKPQNRKLGRRNAAVKAGYDELAGFVMSDGAKSDLQIGWRNFLSGRSVHEAYLETMAAFFRTATQIKGGIEQPLLMPAHQRPTEVQFRYWGPKGEDNQPAWRTYLGVNEWEKEHRPLPGSATDGIVAVGQCASIDATSGDVHLVSVASRLKVVGPLTRITVLDGAVGYITGMYCGFDAPSASTALQAIAHAAADKVAYCARYGIDITADEWIACAHKLYLADNGELRNQQSMAALEQWGATLEYAESGRADRKPVESDHRSAQKKVDHRMPGTTFGRRKKRGEADPATKAALNHYEYVRQHIRRILYHNNKARVPHLLTLEMRRDNVLPFRSNIVKWMCANGYGTAFEPPVEVLRAHFLPEFRAVIRGNGLFLLRPDCDDKRVVYGVRFVGQYLLDSGLMERGRKAVIPAVVRADPNDLSKAWLATPHGLMELTNVNSDTLQIAQATLCDLLAIQDSTTLSNLLNRSEYDQADVEFVTARDIEAEQAIKAKNAAMVAAGRKPSKADLVADRKANRAIEKAAQHRRERSRHAEDVVVAPPAAAVPAPVTPAPNPPDSPPAAAKPQDAKLPTTAAPKPAPTAASLMADALRRVNAAREAA